VLRRPVDINGLFSAKQYKSFNNFFLNIRFSEDTACPVSLYPGGERKLHTVEFTIICTCDEIQKCNHIKEDDTERGRRYREWCMWKLNAFSSENLQVKYPVLRRRCLLESLTRIKNI
jgi:hypothetical protein